MGTTFITDEGDELKGGSDSLECETPLEIDPTLLDDFDPDCKNTLKPQT